MPILISKNDKKDRTNLLVVGDGLDILRDGNGLPIIATTGSTLLAPSMTAFANSIGGNQNSINVVSTPNASVVEWECYARRGTWPTNTFVQAGVLDKDFLVMSGPVSVTSFQMYVSQGVWYFITVPKNRNGDLGGRYTFQYTAP